MDIPRKYSAAHIDIVAVATQAGDPYAIQPLVRSERLGETAQKTRCRMIDRDAPGLNFPHESFGLQIGGRQEMERSAVQQSCKNIARCRRVAERIDQGQPVFRAEWRAFVYCNIICSILRWLCGTPFGIPSEPEVK